MVYENSGSGTLLGSPQASVAYLDLAPMGTAGTDLYFSAPESAQKLLIEPIVPGLSSSLAASPLLYVLKSTDSNPRALVGTFYDVEGKEMYPTSASEKSQYVLAPSDTAKTLYSLAKTAESTFPIYADCREFRGTLYGGPLLITPYYIEPDPAGAIDSDYVPIEGSPILYPGPIILGGDSPGIHQISTNPGFMDPGVGSQSLSNINESGSTTVTVDTRGSVLGILLVSWTQTAGKTLRIQAKRKTTTLAIAGSSSESFTAGILSVDELYTVPTGATGFTAMIELDQGLYDVILSVPAGSTTASAIKWTVQRIQ